MTIHDYSRNVHTSIMKNHFCGYFFTNRYCSPMDSFSDDFKAWMDVNQFTAETLAPIIGKSAGTIANWRSIGVPERESVRRFLTEFMATYQPPAAAPESPDFTVRIEFTDDEMAEVTKAAEIVGTGARDFIRRSAVHQARARLDQETPTAEQQFSALKVADAPGNPSSPSTPAHGAQTGQIKYPKGKRRKKEG